MPINGHYMNKISSQTRRATNLSIDSTLLAQAKKLGINISRAAEMGVDQAVRSAQKKQWLAENQDALNSSNNFVETQGVPLSKYRQF